MIHEGDCIEVMQGMEPESVDSIVTDPPYGLEFMGKEWDNPLRNGWQAAPGTYHNDTNFLATGDRIRYKAGPAFQAWCEAWGREALRVVKPGGYLLAFGGTRTHHRLVCGLEDAGWIIRDELDWIYASGFPKGKANLKPAHEPIVLARKPGPLRPLAIDECRIPGVMDAGWAETKGNGPKYIGQTYNNGKATEGPDQPYEPAAGRWPSNLLLSDPALFDEPQGEVVGSGATSPSAQPYQRNVDGRSMFWNRPMGADAVNGYGDSGGYSRFFIVPKADRADREPVLRGQLPAKEVLIGAERHKINPMTGRSVVDIPRENAHPTVKPLDLMRHLVRLVTPAGGTVLDCFLGSGSTALAAELEGFQWVGIEKEPEYVKIAEARLNGTQKGLGLDVPAPIRAQAKPGAYTGERHPGREWTKWREAGQLGLEDA